METKYRIESWEPKLVGGANWFHLSKDNGLPAIYNDVDEAMADYDIACKHHNEVRLIIIKEDVLHEKRS